VTSAEGNSHIGRPDRHYANSELKYSSLISTPHADRFAYVYHRFNVNIRRCCLSAGFLALHHVIFIGYLDTGIVKLYSIRTQLVLPGSAMTVMSGSISRIAILEPTTNITGQSQVHRMLVLRHKF